MIITVTNITWEPVSQDLYPWWHRSRDLARDPFSLANLVPKLSQDVCLGKGSGGTFKTLRYPFYLLSAASWKVYNVLLKLVRVGTLSAAFWCLCQALCLFFNLTKLYYRKALSDQASFLALDWILFWRPKILASFFFRGSTSFQNNSRFSSFHSN